MKRILLSLLPAIIFSSCSVEYTNYEHGYDRPTVTSTQAPVAQPIKRTREIIWEEPKVTRVRVEPIVRVERPIVRVEQPVIHVQRPVVQTTRVIYNTTPVVRTYNYRPSTTYVQRNYSYSYNKTCRSSYPSSSMHVRVSRSHPVTTGRLTRPVSRYCPHRGWHFTSF